MTCRSDQPDLVLRVDSQQLGDFRGCFRTWRRRVNDHVEIGLALDDEGRILQQHKPDFGVLNFLHALSLGADIVTRPPLVELGAEPVQLLDKLQKTGIGPARPNQARNVASAFFASCSQSTISVRHAGCVNTSLSELRS